MKILGIIFPGIPKVPLGCEICIAYFSNSSLFIFFIFNLKK